MSHSVCCCCQLLVHVQQQNTSKDAAGDTITLSFTLKINLNGISLLFAIPAAAAAISGAKLIIKISA
jgi:hypothetical protein